MEIVIKVLYLIWTIIVYVLNAYAILSIKEFFNKKEAIITFRVILIILVFLINNNVLPLSILRYVDYVLLIIYFAFYIKRRKMNSKKKKKKKTHK